jgi:hypothetical protein
MKIIDKILQREEFNEKPPVLMDIGASGEIFKDWKKIAQYSICVAFDADTREIDYIKNDDKYKKAYVFNRIASPDTDSERDFYLTESPFCSSSLEPRKKELEDWNFSDKFEVRERVRLKTISPADALRKIGIYYVDWFKADTQGMDLSLFKNLGNQITDKMLAADFEPGVIDSYQGEEKLHALMAYMDNQPFWMNELNIQGSQRIRKVDKDKLMSKMNKLSRRFFKQIIKSAPVCGEASYFNTLEKDIFDKRDLLLMWIFATIKKQYGFAIDIATRGSEKYADPIFEELEKETIKEMNKEARKIYPRYLIKKMVRKIK